MSRPETFEPAAYRKSIADMFGILDAAAQRELADRLSILPRHIHRLAIEGRIALGNFKEPPKAVAASG